jgi:hypothetical protein
MLEYEAMPLFAQWHAATRPPVTVIVHFCCFACMQLPCGRADVVWRCNECNGLALLPRPLFLHMPRPLWHAAGRQTSGHSGPWGPQHLRQTTAQGNATPKRIPVRTPGGPEQMGSIALPVCLTIWAAALRHAPCPVLPSVPPLLLRCRHGGHSFISGQHTAFPPHQSKLIKKRKPAVHILAPTRPVVSLPPLDRVHSLARLHGRAVRVVKTPRKASSSIHTSTLHRYQVGARNSPTITRR